MWSKLQEVFDYLALPYYRQGSLAEDDDIPESFYTFWNTDTKDLSHYDDEPHRIEWTWRVWAYTDDASEIYSHADNLIAAAQASGFIVIGRGRDIDAASPTTYGREITLKFIEELKGA